MNIPYLTLCIRAALYGGAWALALIGENDRRRIHTISIVGRDKK